MALNGLASFVTGGKPTQSASVKVDATQVDRMLERTWEALSPASLEVVLRGPIHKHFEDEIVGRFASQGDRQVGHWPDLSEATQNIRSQDGFGPDWPINIRTGEMFDVLTEHADFMPTETGAEMTLPGNAGGQIAAKLKTAQSGRTVNPIDGFGPTPPRPVLAADESDLMTVLGVLNAYIIEFVSGSVI